MSIECQKFLDSLGAISAGVKSAEQEMLKEWFPELPPVTTLFAAVGYRIAEDFDKNGEQINRSLFSLIESAMKSDDLVLGTAVATGLLEALVGRVAQEEGLWVRISPLLGPSSLHHAEAWMSPDAN